ncbi:MAG: hypothetical protein V7651_07170 [Hyphomonas oceanitis]|uniref:hypothetical protein n=1 Tax=Hyphomonas oceanitis TaxID=81033 RepID=UPI0030032914
MTLHGQLGAVFQRTVPTVSNGNVYAGGFSRQRLLISPDNSAWYNALNAKFDELTSLQRGWDGYSGLPVSFSCAKFAANILNRLCVDNICPPSLVPGSDGTLQIEWHMNQYDVEIDVLGAQNVVATRYDLLSEIEETVELQNDFTIISSWIDDLAKDRRDEVRGAA